MTTFATIAPRLANAHALAQEVARIFSDHPGLTPDALSISAIAANAESFFETRKRDDDETFTTQKDTSPEWVRDMTMTAHGDFLPEDWRYDAIRSALDAIEDAQASTRDDLDDAGTEWADGHVDVYTRDRLLWLASNLNRPGYVDDGVSEGLCAEDADITDRIGIGQYMEAREVWELVVSSLADVQEGLTDELDAIDYHYNVEA